MTTQGGARARDREPITRRRLLQAGAVVGAAWAGAGLPAWGQQKKPVLVVADGGGSWAEAVTDAFCTPFAAAADVEVRRAVYDYSPGKIKAQIESRAIEWTVAEVNWQSVFVEEAAELYEPLDYRVVTASADVGKEFVTKFSTAHYHDGIVLTYNKEKFGKNPPQGWADLWDLKKFPGPRSAANFPRNQLEVALLADGVPPANLYPLDVDRALRKWDEIRKQVVWYSSGAQQIQYFVDREVDLGIGWNGRVRAMIERQKAPFESVYNGHLITAGSYVVLKGAALKDRAMQFINFALQPQQQTAFAKKLGGVSPTNAKAYPLLPEEMSRYLPASPMNLLRGIPRNEAWWGKNMAAMTERWEKWRASW